MGNFKLTYFVHSRFPTEEDILRTCNTLAEKLSADVNAKNDVKLALMDLLEEALQGQLLCYVHTRINYLYN